MASPQPDNAYLTPWSTELRFVPTEAVDPTDTESRRKHIRAYFTFVFGPPCCGFLPRAGIAVVREMVAGDMLHNKEQRSIGHESFEYMVDKLLWQLAFEAAAGELAPAWPWAQFRPV